MRSVTGLLASAVTSSVVYPRSSGSSAASRARDMHVNTALRIGP